MKLNNEKSNITLVGVTSYASYYGDPANPN